MRWFIHWKSVKIHQTGMNDQAEHLTAQYLTCCETDQRHEEEDQFYYSSEAENLNFDENL